MGYDLHITRLEEWGEEDEPNIPLDEWLAYAKRDKELELTSGSDIEIGSESAFENRPGYCEWNAHPTERKPGEQPWFAFWEGRIYTKNPDTPTIRKMIHMASVLNAKVQGDDGEFYTEEYLVELENANRSGTSSTQQGRKPWWKFW